MVMLPRMTPLTEKTTIRGPLAAQASCRLPGPEGFSVVTLMTLALARLERAPGVPATRGRALEAVSQPDIMPIEATERDKVRRPGHERAVA